MKRTLSAIGMGCVLGCAISGALIIVSPHAAAMLSQYSKNIYLDSSFILFALTIALLREILHERRALLSLNLKSHETEINLYEQQNRFETIFDHTATGIALLKLDGNIFRVNQSICELLGYSEALLLAMNYYYLIPPENTAKLKIHLQELLDNKIQKYQFEHECLRKDGEMFWIKSVVSLIRDNREKPQYFILQMQNISLQKKAEERLRHMAYHDPLTGLANRNKLEHFINQLLASARRHQQEFALMFLDLDRFKTINDTIGHEAGDVLLQIVGERLRRTVRNSDIVARLGGDEFVLLITEVKHTEAVASIAHKILNNIMQVIVIEGHEIYITTSIGISLHPYDGKNMQMLMKNADLALYRAKEQGRNNFQFYTQEMTSRAQEKLKIQSSIGHAFAKNEFLLHYQPKMNIKSRQITGVEALLRWSNKEFGMITPNEIITLAEDTGLIIPISEWILKNACKQLKLWHEMGFSSLTVAVNCSSRQFKQTTYIDNILNIISQTGLPPSSLEIEVTEKTIMQDPENTLRVLYALKDIGVKIVIDNFGTGYWSLNNLRRLSVDKIKIDQSFIKQITVDETSAMIIRAIIAMVNKLGISSVATGVETREQYEFLSKEGCVEIQGYYLSQALSEDMLSSFLRHPIPVAEVISQEEIS